MSDLPAVPASPVPVVADEKQQQHDIINKRIVYQTSKLADNNMTTLKESMKEYTRNLKRHLSEAVYIYMTRLYVRCVKDVKEKKAEFQGPYADLKWFQVQLKDMLKWNEEQIKEATREILDLKKGWRFPQILKTVFHIKSMIQASIRPADMNEDVFVGIPAPTTFIHRVLVLTARDLFADPTVMRCTQKDDAETVMMNRDRVYRYIAEAISNAIIDLTPTDDIIDRYVSVLLQSMKNDTGASEATSTAPSVDIGEARKKKEADDDLVKYGFEARVDDIDDDDEEEDEEEEEEEYTDEEESEYDDEYTEEDGSEIESCSDDDEHKVTGNKRKPQHQHATRSTAASVPPQTKRIAVMDAEPVKMPHSLPQSALPTTPAVADRMVAPKEIGGPRRDQPRGRPNNGRDERHHQQRHHH
jgi:hypothetical protein